MATEDILENLAFRLRPISKKHHAVRAIVFGSLARGEISRLSDLDLIIIQNTEKRFLDRYDNLLSEIVRAVPGLDVDLFLYTPQELRRMDTRPFIKTALAEGKVIYEPGEEPQRS